MDVEINEILKTNNLYKILNVTRNCESTVIKKSYRKVK